MNTTGIDFDQIRQTVDLRRVIEADLGPPLRGGRWACPIHGGDGPNFSVGGDGRHWRCWTCGANGDVFDYLARRENITVAEAAARLDPSLASRRPSRPVARPKPAPAPAVPPAAKSSPLAAWGDPEWQAAVDGVVRQAEVTLWSEDGRAALDWLRARGLDDPTIRRFRLGFNPADFNTAPVGGLGRGIRVSRGVTIPWVRPGAWYSAADGDPGNRWVGCNVRRLPPGDLTGSAPDPKYRALAGSERGHGYPWPEATATGDPAVVCEGEFDALVAWQEFGHVVNTVTFGGASQSVSHEDARAFLNGCPDWLLLYDNDDSGDTAARAMTRKAPHRCRRLFLPHGVNDLNDLHRVGESVREWLALEYVRFGWVLPRSLVLTV